MQIVVLKIIISVFIVLTLVFISERNPKLGGLLTGLPLGTGIMIFFYGMEQGVPFVLSSIPYGITGMISTVAFGIGFYLGGKIKIENNLLRTLFSFFCGIVTYLTFSGLFSLFSINLLVSIIIFITGFILAQFFYRRVKERPKVAAKKFSFWVLLFRMSFVILIVLTITGIAKIIGPKWAGLIASFPTILTPLLLILSFTYKDQVYPNLLKHLAYSISTIFLFYFLILWLFPLLDVVWGIIAAYAICFVYLLLLNKFDFYRTNKPV